MIALQLDAGHDKNGKPRRCFVVFDNTGNIRAVIDEGYNGEQGVRRWAKKTRNSVHMAGSITTTPGEYRELLRQPCAVQS